MKGSFLLICMVAYVFSFAAILALAAIGAASAVDPAHTTKWLVGLMLVNIIACGWAFARAIQNSDK